jgi:hypothetical protein
MIVLPKPGIILPSVLRYRAELDEASRLGDSVNPLLRSEGYPLYSGPSPTLNPPAWPRLAFLCEDLLSYGECLPRDRQASENRELEEYFRDL